MPVRPRAHTTGPTCTHRSNYRTPQDIAEVIDRLSAAIQADGNCELYAGWAVATLAAKLGVTVSISSSPDPVEVIEDLGEYLAYVFGTGLDDVSPGKVAEVLRAAQAVVTRIVEEVRRRGLAG